MTTPTPAQRARRVIGITVIAWDVKRPGAHAVARRAPHGHRPACVPRRLRAAAAFGPAPLLAHSW